MRKEILALRDALSQKERQEKSIQISDKVIELKSFQNANIVLMYDAIRSEVETARIYREARRLSKVVYFPRVIESQMEFYLVDEATEFEISRFGVREPKMEAEKQFVPDEQSRIFVLMPGAVFDEAGNRIGYGGGYYDKYLHWLEDRVLSERVCKVAVAYECQMVDQGRIVKEAHDVHPDYIVTESRICEIGKEHADGKFL